MRALTKKVGVLLGVFASSLVSCGAYVLAPTAMPTTVTPKGAARVCIVRQGADGALSIYPVRDNGALVGATVGESCFCYFAAGGHHELEARSDGYDLLEVDIQPDTEVVILQRTQSAVGIVRSRLEVLTSDEGKDLLASCQYSVLVQVPDGMIKTDPTAVITGK